MRAKYGQKKARDILSIDAARANKFTCDWSSVEIAKPAKLGVETILPSIEELRRFIDWSPFFHTWELRGRWNSKEQTFSSAWDEADKKAGAESEAAKLYKDANHLLDIIIKEKRVTPKGVVGFFEANSVGDDVVLANGTTLHTLRQQQIKKDTPNYALADFIAPKDSGRIDYCGGFTVTTGHGVDERAKAFEAAHDDYNALLLKALADRLAEAFAERMHKEVRDLWGFGKNENLTAEEIIREKYRGIRPAPGYPACPDHTEKWTLFDLLESPKHTGVVLTESLAMMPASSVSGFYFAHPEAKYFAVGKLCRDQIEDYAARKGMTIPQVEKWLSPYLNYEPSAEG
jgi:5-methyltetrahydrofolate--homocysteine methyltransferase